MKLPARRHVKFSAIALVLGLCAAAPLFLSNYPLFVLSLAIVNCIAVLGVNLVMGHAGQISLGQAGFAAIGAYATALLTVNFDLSYWLAVPLGAPRTFTPNAFCIIPRSTRSSRPCRCAPPKS